MAMPSRGLTFHQEIQDAVAARERLVLVVGPKAGVSDYVRQEWQFALQADKAVTPILRPQWPVVRGLKATAWEGRFGRQGHNMSVSVEVGAEELQEASLTEEGVMQSSSNEPNRGRPLESFDAVADPELHHDVSAEEKLRPAGQGDGALFGLGEINPQSGGHRVAENSVVSACVEQAVAQLRGGGAGQQYRQHGAMANLLALKGRYGLLGRNRHVRELHSMISMPPPSRTSSSAGTKAIKTSAELYPAARTALAS